MVSWNDYYPFGMQMPGRSGNSSEYSYGFQGQLKDDEIKGEGNSINYKYRMHDPRIGRFFAVDPLASKMPEWSPYVAFADNPVFYVDPDGKEPIDPRTGKPISLNFNRAAVYDPHYIERTNFKVVKDKDLYYNNDNWIPRERAKPDGSWEGGAFIGIDYVWMYTSRETNKALGEITGREGGTDYGSSNDPTWREVAELGTYQFVDDRWAESEVFRIDLTEFNIMTVEQNYITQTINMKRADGYDEYTINSVTDFKIEKGEVKTREVSSWFFWTKTEKYRELKVTETTTHYKDNQPGKSTSKTYNREEIVE